MLSGPSFRSTFILTINSLILSGFSLTSFHLINTHYVHFCDFILLRVQLYKNITKCLLYIVVQILVPILQSACFICTT